MLRQIFYKPPLKLFSGAIFALHIFICPEISFGQSLKIQDSLQNQLDKAKDTSKYYILKELSWEKRNTNATEAYHYGKQALELAEKYNMADEIASLHNYLGIFKRNQYQYREALNHYIFALKYADSINNSTEIAYAHNNIGEIYRRLNNDSLAIVNYTKALETFKKIELQRGIAYCYNQLCLLYLKINNYDQALSYNNQSIQLRKKMDDWVGISANYRNNGDIYVKKGDYIMAEAYYRRALELDEKYEQQLGLGYTNNQIGKLYNYREEYEKAIPHLMKSLQIGYAVNSPIVIFNASQNLSYAYEQMNDYKKAYEYHRIFKESADSLYSEENARNITQLTMQFEFDKLQLERERLAQQKTRRQKLIQNLTLSGLFIMILVVFIIYRSYTVKKRANKLLYEKNNQISEQKEELILINNQLKESEQMLREANSTRDKFFSIIAHDLRSPFNTIFGFTNLLYKDIEDYDEKTIKGFLLNILIVTDNAYKLLQNLLDWAMSQTGEIKFKPTNFDLYAMIKDTTDLLQDTANQKEIKVESKIGKGNYVNGDMNMISTVCRNLISNAIKFTPRKGSIVISSYMKNNHIVVSFKDNGVGISKENIYRLFQIDEKIKTDGTENEKGTGLGLILCKEFIQKHGGEIWVESVVGQGSNFYISLPQAKEFS